MARMHTRKGMIQRGLKSSLIGIGFNLVLALFKCSTGFIGHSFALIADGIESLSDVISSPVVYLGLRLTSNAPDEEKSAVLE
jgi:divalent metal cation (Fe/Co/Zn/Cd) transporter